jgi:hypothetical protein
MLCVHEVIKVPAELVTIVKLDEILSPSLYVWCSRDQKYITTESSSTWHWLNDHQRQIVVQGDGDHDLCTGRIICWSDGGVNLYTGVSAIEPTVNLHHWLLGRRTRRRCRWSLHRRLMCRYDGFDSLETVESFSNVVVVYIHSRIVLQCDWNKDLIMNGS